jgi:hypothetical protein
MCISERNPLQPRDVDILSARVGSKIDENQAELQNLARNTNKRARIGAGDVDQPVVVIARLILKPIQLLMRFQCGGTRDSILANRYSPDQYSLKPI